MEHQSLPPVRFQGSRTVRHPNRNVLVSDSQRIFLKVLFAYLVFEKLKFMNRSLAGFRSKVPRCCTSQSIESSFDCSLQIRTGSGYNLSRHWILQVEPFVLYQDFRSSVRLSTEQQSRTHVEFQDTTARLCGCEPRLKRLSETMDLQGCFLVNHTLVSHS